ncbi:MAG TPA: universal stress protein [Acidimicrobiales bacterium]|nr:universal stress protein [Acidimicrobiales bacterium]
MTDQYASGTIVVGVDGSGHAEAALDWALGQGEVTGAQVVAVTCWEYPVNFGWVPPMPTDFRPDEDARTMLDQAVEKAQAEHPGVKVRRLVVEGTPASVLLDAAKGAELLVVGTRGHGGFAGLLLGSVSEHCVAHAPCPVVVVRH